jgi:hypothetical protein
VSGVLTYEALGAFKSLGRFNIIGVGNNQIGSPIVSLGRLSVEMHEGPTFSKEGKEKGSQGNGVPLLVLPEVDTIDIDST